jgi:hypothetical protein
LFPEDDRGSVGSDETPEFGPEVAGIVNPFALTGGAERLARARSGPTLRFAPSCKIERERPSADAGEEVALVESNEVIGRHILDRPPVHDARRYQPVEHQVLEPLGGVGVYFVVPVHSPLLLRRAYSRA